MIPKKLTILYASVSRSHICKIDQNPGLTGIGICSATRRCSSGRMASPFNIYSYFLISRIHFLISRNIKNSIPWYQEFISWYQELNSWYQEFISWYQEFPFVDNGKYFLDIKNSILDIKNSILDIKNSILDIKNTINFWYQELDF